ncbi:MAG: penicillin-binding transpeptidase domain-containing protein [Acidimicrobiia bacterium]
MVGWMSEANSRRRLAVIGLVVVALFAGLLTRLWFLQVAGGEDLAVAAQQNGDKIVQVPAIRGRILDAKGRVLAETLPVTSLVVDRPKLTGSSRAKLVANLSTLLDVPKEDVEARIDDPNYSDLQPVPLSDAVSIDLAAALIEHSADYPYASLTHSFMRVYPQYDGMQLAAHAIGYVGRISEEEYAARKGEGYANDDILGKAGVEKTFESELRGKPELLKVRVNNRGLAIDSSVVRPAEPGHDVQLTLDVDAQRVAEVSLQQGIDGARGNGMPANAGAVVVLDARTGGVVALASNPTFDPNAFANGTAPDEWFDPNGPLNTFDRALNAYAPGSTFKMITAAAQLEEPNQIRNSTDTYYDEGCFKFGNEEKRCNSINQATGKPIENGSVDLASALTVSSDVYFYNVGNDFWKRYYNNPPDGEGGINEEGNVKALGLDGDLAAHPEGYRIQSTAFRFGFGKATGIGLLGDQAGRIPTRSFNVGLNQTAADSTSRTWRRGDSASLAVGQGDVLVTPLQLANAYATFANGGTLYTPRLASAVLASGVGLPAGQVGEVVHPLDPQTLRAGVITPEIRAQLLPGLVGVVNDGNGTAYFSFLGYSGPLMGGKTGTAQVADGDDEDTSWFVGFTNAENDPNLPLYVIVAMVEQGGFGAEVSAPIVRRVTDFLAGDPNPPAVRVGKKVGRD